MKKNFVDDKTGMIKLYLTPAPECPTEEVKCHRNRPSRRKLKDCPIDAVGKCPDANAERGIINELLTDPQAVRAILDAADHEELLVRLPKMHDAEVPDDSFFKLLAECGPSLLSLPVAQEKMARWQQDLSSRDSDVKFKARDSLEKIGATMTKTGHQRDNPSPGMIAIYWDMYFKEFCARELSKKRQVANLRLILREILSSAPENIRLDPEGIERILGKITTGKQTNKRLADIVAAEAFNLTTSTVRQYRKEAKLLKDVYQF